MFGGGFGGFGGFGGQQEEETPRGNDVFVDLHVTLKDLYVGHSFQVVRDKNVIKPAPGQRECNCRNKVVTRQIGPGMYQQFQQRECERCPNVKLAREEERLTVTVEAGMREGHEISFFEEGEPMIDGEAGDLKFLIRTQPDSRFQREGNDLRYNHTISLLDALVGFKQQIKHLDGHGVTLESSTVTQPMQIVRIQGEGMPLFEHPHQHGNLYVMYIVDFPAQLTTEQKQLAQKMFEGQQKDEL